MSSLTPFYHYVQLFYLVTSFCNIFAETLKKNLLRQENFLPTQLNCRSISLFIYLLFSICLFFISNVLSCTMICSKSPYFSSELLHYNRFNICTIYIYMYIYDILFYCRKFSSVLQFMHLEIFIISSKYEKNNIQILSINI